MRRVEYIQSMLAHTFVWLQVNVGYLRGFKLDSTNPLYFMLSEVGQAERLGHRGLDNRR